MGLEEVQGQKTKLGHYQPLFFLGTNAVPKPRARGLSLWTPHPLALAGSLARNFPPGGEKYDLRSDCRRQRSLSVHREFFLAGVFLLPMLADGRADAHQPVAVFDLFQ